MSLVKSTLLAGAVALGIISTTAFAGSKGIKIGDSLPELSSFGLEGSLPNDLKGKVVVIDFWATWCGPCRKGLPLLQTFADQMKGNDKVAIYAVNVWEQQKGEELTKKVTDFWTKQAFTMNVAMDPEAKLITQYGFQGIPACIIIGADGMLVSSHMGYDPEMVSKLTADVNKALGVKDAGAAAPDSKAADSKGSGTKAPGLTK